MCQQSNTEGDTDPDWDTIVLHDPARTDVPLFLNSRDRRDAVDVTFGQALDDLHATLTGFVKNVLDASAEIHESVSIKLNKMEEDLKTSFNSNEKARDSMETKLQKSARAAQDLFDTLLQKLTQTQGAPHSDKEEDELENKKVEANNAQTLSGDSKAILEEMKENGELVSFLKKKLILYDVHY